MPLHRGKLQCRAEGWFRGALGAPKGPSLLWLAGTWAHTLPREDACSHLQCIGSILQTEEEWSFSCLFLEKTFSGEHRTNNFFSQRFSPWPVLAEAMETCSFCLSFTHPWKKQVPICLLASYFVVHSLWDQTKQCFWLNQPWSPSIDPCHSPTASFRITPCIIISLQLSLGINLNLGGWAGGASELCFLSFLTDLWRILNSHLFEKSWL